MDIREFESSFGVSLPVPAIEEIADIVEGLNSRMGVNGSIAVENEGEFELLFKGDNKERVIHFAEEHESLIESMDCFKVKDGVDVQPKDFGEMVDAIDVNIVVVFDGCE